MQLFKRVTMVSLACALVLGLAACGGSKSSNSKSAVDSIVESGKIIMVTNAEFEPFEYKDGNEVIGIDAEIAALIAEELGVELEITDIAFDSCIPSVTEGKADFAAAGMTVTEDRLKNVDFTDTYFKAAQSIIVPKDSDIKTLEDLAGKTVGVQLGTTGDIFCSESDLGMKVEQYRKGVDAVTDLAKSDRLDAVVIDNYPAMKLAAANADAVEVLDVVVTEEEEYAIAVAKGSDLTAKINEILKKAKEDGRFDAIITKYLGE